VRHSGRQSYQEPGVPLWGRDTVQSRPPSETVGAAGCMAAPPAAAHSRATGGGRRTCSPADGRAARGPPRGDEHRLMGAVATGPVRMLPTRRGLEAGRELPANQATADTLLDHRPLEPGQYFEREGRARTRIIRIAAASVESAPERGGVRPSAPSASSLPAPTSGSANGFVAPDLRTVANAADGQESERVETGLRQPIETQQGRTVRTVRTQTAAPIRPRKNGLDSTAMSVADALREVRVAGIDARGRERRPCS
jgi:hypothetical protein